MIKLVAEIGINHNGSLETAMRLMDAAAAAGWSHVKFQKRNPDLCVPESQKATLRNTPWGKMTYIDYKRRIELSSSDYDSLFSHARSLGIVPFASVFDIDSLAFMEGRCDLVKVGSANMNDIGLCAEARRRFATLMVSTGMSSEKQVDECVSACSPDVVMHTVSSYPCEPADLWLNRIHWMMLKYPGREIGYSGHELGSATVYAAAGMGVRWIERHVTLDRGMWGSDQSASMEPQEMASMASGIGEIELALSRPPSPREVMRCEMSKMDSCRISSDPTP